MSDREYLTKTKDNYEHELQEALDSFDEFAKQSNDVINFMTTPERETLVNMQLQAERDGDTTLCEDIGNFLEYEEKMRDMLMSQIASRLLMKVRNFKTFYSQ